MTRIAVLGAGAAAAQIGCEYALGGCAVLWADESEAAQQRVEEALRMASAHGLAGPPELERARSSMAHGDPTISSVERLTLLIDAQTGPLAERVGPIRAIAARHPEALVATVSLLPSVTELGEAAEVGERMLVMRYGEPPLLSPIVELLPARDTPRRLLDRVSQLLRAIGKRPIALQREVAGLVSGRLEVALLREAAWLLERGVVDAEELDALVRDSLARRWAPTGLLASAALGDADELAALADAIGSESARTALDALPARVAASDPDAVAQLRERRDQAMSAALRAERAAAGRTQADGA